MITLFAFQNEEDCHSSRNDLPMDVTDATASKSATISSSTHFNDFPLMVAARKRQPIDGSTLALSPAPTDGLSPQQLKRRHIVAAILHSENSYVATLQRLVNVSLQLLYLHAHRFTNRIGTSQTTRVTRYSATVRPCHKYSIRKTSKHGAQFSDHITHQM